MNGEAFKVVKESGSIQIRQYRGSTGYQVWCDGAFRLFMPTLELAIAFLPNQPAS